MEEAVKNCDLATLGTILRQDATIPMSTAKMAACRLADRPQSRKRRKVVELLLDHGWNVNEPIDKSLHPLLR